MRKRKEEAKKEEEGRTKMRTGPDHFGPTYKLAHNIKNADWNTS
jgi:hypothetical protein